MNGNIFLKVDEFLTKGEHVVLARIISRKGSAPRTVGSKCIITGDGGIIGTIGGGFLEHMVREQAKEVLEKGKSCLYHFQLTGKDLSKADMLCGGVLDVYLDPLYPENRLTRALFNKIKEFLKTGRKGNLLTLISEGINALDYDARMLIGQDGSTEGALKGFSGDLEDLKKIKRPSLTEIAETGAKIFVESIEPDAALFLFGAGHVSTFVSHLAKIVGFQVTVIDDRAEYANRERFPEADEILVVPFSQALEYIQVTDNSYITIITRGHISDKTVLKSALQTSPAYIGMIGSSRKRDQIYQALIKEGIPRERLDEVHSPIGLDIKAETPEEIAVSIVAELIKARAESSRGVTAANAGN